MDIGVDTELDISAEDRELLRRTVGSMPLVADIGRSDVLLYVPLSDREAVLLAHACPHSLSPIHSSNLQGRRVGAQDEPYVFRVLHRARSTRGERVLIPGTAPIVQTVHPVRARGGRMVGALSTETHLFEHERQQRRRRPFHRRRLRRRDQHRRR